MRLTFSSKVGRTGETHETPQPTQRPCPIFHRQEIHREQTFTRADRAIAAQRNKLACFSSRNLRNNCTLVAVLRRATPLGAHMSKTRANAAQRNSATGWHISAVETCAIIVRWSRCSHGETPLVHSKTCGHDWTSIGWLFSTLLGFVEAGKTLLGFVEVELLSADDTHHNVEDTKLAGGQRADHNATRGKARRAEIDKAGLGGNVRKARDHSA